MLQYHFFNFDTISIFTKYRDNISILSKIILFADLNLNGQVFSVKIRQDDIIIFIYKKSIYCYIKNFDISAGDSIYQH